jgi:hypothetical protein
MRGDFGDFVSDLLVAILNIILQWGGLKKKQRQFD